MRPISVRMLLALGFGTLIVLIAGICSMAYVATEKLIDDAEHVREVVLEKRISQYAVGWN